MANAKLHVPSLSRVMDGILYPLWDLGFKIGHSVRTIDESVKVANKDANKDMQTKTSLIEARLICGDQKLFDKFQKAIVAKCVHGHVDEYITARLQDQAARHEKFGNSATMQEPNIKNGCGGLRDFQNLHWLAFFKYGTRTLEEMEQREFIGAADRKQLEAAYDFLLAVRNELHYQVSRPIDVISKSLQPTVAHFLGYTDRSPGKRLEKFMRDLYTHSRNIYLITRSVEERALPLLHSCSWPQESLSRARCRLAFDCHHADALNGIGHQIQSANHSRGNSVASEARPRSEREGRLSPRDIAGTSRRFRQ